ncbi:MAG: methionyl-tRNA formyltransferase [Pseudomonadota bacterium]
MNKRFKIVFMGTPDFAVPALAALHECRHEVKLVVTQPDRPRGRGRKLTPSPVKTAARKMGYDIVQPETIRDRALEKHLRELAPDLFIVVAFGHILGKKLLQVPRIGAINIHASLLPKYRGPAPIQWAILNGEKKTGVTTMFMDDGMDTGDILLSTKVEIRPDDTSATLHDRLALLGGDLLVKTLSAIETGETIPLPQDHDQATYTTLLKKEDGRIDWEKPVESLDAFIRGMSPWPGAFTFFEDKRLKIFAADPVPLDVAEKPGTVVRGFPDELRVAAGKGVLLVQEIQGASGKRLKIKDFLKGCRIPPGTVLR